MDNNFSEQLEAMQARLDSLVSENQKLKMDNLELSGELSLYKPSRVELAPTPDRRTAKDFASPKANIKQFTLQEAAKLPETELLRAITNHMVQQIPNLVGAPVATVENVRIKYPQGLLRALTGSYKDARRNGFRDFSHCLNLQKFGFVPFVSDQELKAAIF
jgi:TolA-binding protein